MGTSHTIRARPQEVYGKLEKDYGNKRCTTDFLQQFASNQNQIYDKNRINMSFQNVFADSTYRSDCRGEEVGGTCFINISWEL